MRDYYFVATPHEGCSHKHKNLKTAKRCFQTADERRLALRKFGLGSRKLGIFKQSRSKPVWPAKQVWPKLARSITGTTRQGKT